MSLQLLKRYHSLSQELKKVFEAFGEVTQFTLDEKKHGECIFLRYTK